MVSWALSCWVLLTNSVLVSAVSWSSSVNSLLKPHPMIPRKQLHSGVDSGLVHSVAEGAQLALQHCQREFQWERWNCPDSVFSRKGRQIVTKEAAFVSAITAAGIIHSVAKACRRGDLGECGTDPLTYAEKAAAEFLLALEGHSRDVAAAVNRHNYIIGQQVVRGSVRKDCQCDGLCRNKVCRTIEGSFDDITGQLRRRYNNAIRVEWNGVNSDGEPRRDRQNLLYLVQSPDYCQPNNTTDWPGTAGRSCSRERGPQVSRSERRSCRELCRTCGFSVQRQVRTLSSQCHCQFHWCCSVSCQQCDKVVREHFCG